MQLYVRQMSYRYPEGVPALVDVSLTARTGESIAIVGANGSGKSTLLLQMNGTLKPTEGLICLDGQESTSRKQLRTSVGLVAQDPDDQLCMPTVRDDVAFGPLNQGLPTGEVLDRVQHAMEEAAILHLADRAPHRLSTGEKRMVALAGIRAMAFPILALDEPSAGLDPRSRRRLIHWIRQMSCTRILATHDLEMVVETCERVIVLSEGRIVATGAVTEILGDERLMLEHGLERPHILLHRHPHG